MGGAGPLLPRMTGMVDSDVAFFDKEVEPVIVFEDTMDGQGSGWGQYVNM